jgi:hypothetical protein
MSQVVSMAQTVAESCPSVQTVRMNGRVVDTAIAAAAALLLLSGCSATGATDGLAPTVTVTAEPHSESPEIGDELTPLNAWDICFAHTTTQVRSDLTEWSRYAAEQVEQLSAGTFVVTIDNVRSGSDADDFGTVTCRVEGRVGGAIIAEWARSSSS